MRLVQFLDPGSAPRGRVAIERHGRCATGLPQGVLGRGVCATTTPTNHCPSMPTSIDTFDGGSAGLARTSPRQNCCTGARPACLAPCGSSMSRGCGYSHSESFGSVLACSMLPP